MSFLYNQPVPLQIPKKTYFCLISYCFGYVGKSFLSEVLMLPYCIERILLAVVIR